MCLEVYKLNCRRVQFNKALRGIYNSDFLNLFVQFNLVVV